MKFLSQPFITRQKTTDKICPKTNDAPCRLFRCSNIYRPSYKASLICCMLSISINFSPSAPVNFQTFFYFVSGSSEVINLLFLYSELNMVLFWMTDQKALENSQRIKMSSSALFWVSGQVSVTISFLPRRCHLRVGHQN